jgi:hypothetical protein
VVLRSFCRSRLHLPASLRSIPITGLHRYYGGSDSCPPGSSAPVWQHEHRLLGEQVSLIHASGPLIIPPPTTLGLPPSLSHPTPQRVGLLTPVSPGFAIESQARQLSGRIAFVILRTDRSPPAAPHPALRRRSCSRLQAGEGVPEEDFHLSDQMRFQAHNSRFRGNDGMPFSNVTRCTSVLRLMLTLIGSKGC